MLRGLVIAFALSFGPAVSNSFARFAYALVLPAMRNDLGWSWSQAGSINTVNALGYLLGALLTRALVVRVGNRRLFIAGMVITSCALIVTADARNLMLLSSIRVVTGIGGAMVFICGGALSGNIFPSRPQLATTTIAIFFGGAGFGLMACGVAIPYALEWFGDATWPQVWRGMGYASLLMTLASGRAAWLITEPGLPGAGAVADGAWSWRGFGYEFAAYGMFAIGYIGYMTFVIAWIRDNGGDTATVALVWFMLGLATLLAPLLWRRPAERWPGGWPLAAVMLMLTVGAAIPMFATSLGAMLVSAVLFGGAMFSAPSAISSLIKKSLPKPAWGSAMATFTAVFAAGQVLGPVATGWLADRYGSLRPGLTASVVVLLAGALLACLQREPTGAVSR